MSKMRIKIKVLSRVFLFVYFVSICSFLYAESCSSQGNTEEKYTASGCSYTTQTRTCCSNNTWSGWDEECKMSCKNNECWDGWECLELGSEIYPDPEWGEDCLRLDCPAGYICGHRPTCVDGEGWDYDTGSVSCVKLPIEGNYSSSTERVYHYSTTAGCGGSVTGMGNMYCCDYLMTDSARDRYLSSGIFEAMYKSYYSSDKIKKYCQDNYKGKYVDEDSWYVSTSGGNCNAYVTVYNCSGT